VVRREVVLSTFVPTDGKPGEGPMRGDARATRSAAAADRAR
jgi:hypothetical protein